MKYLRILFNSFILTFGISMPLSHAIAAGESVNKVVLTQSPDLHKPTTEKSESRDKEEKALSGKGSININTANAEELAKALNGVGAKKAQAIIEYREKYGPFTAIEQLQEVQGIGPAFIEKNRDKLTY
ncbi:competence protein ComEA [Xenorhabdus cabanillasii]|uniref:Competence protein ComEA n=1 Tax=Xenorhabdus cabanillasii TaxID=351673 RepID=A0A3D9UC86_9GAMM|nr:ComEA family DNA-binding protein [Xenorhabdus cabanillasii]REF27118.1 competence protein ComEA [Xenorhabdus cabanillasii]